MPPKRKAKIPARALKRGTMLWSKEFTERIAEDMADWSDPEFMKTFMNFCYGGLYDRKVLPQKTRELCAVSACVMANAHPQLRTHIQAAWNCGATKREIMEVIIQMMVYCGAPYVLQCARVAWNDVFPDLKKGQKASASPPGLRKQASDGKRPPSAKKKTAKKKAAKKKPSRSR